MKKALSITAVLVCLTTSFATSAPSTSFETLTFTGFLPPDPTIAAGPTSLVAVVNSRIAIYDKAGNEIFSQALSGSGGFWATLNSVISPWVVFDPDSQRFFVMGMDFVSGPTSASSRIYLAVSTSSSPTATVDWWKYIIDRTGTHTTTGVATFPDYPKLGVAEDAVYITGNDFAIAGPGGFSHVSLFAIEKAPLTTGGPANIVYDEVITGAFSIHPVVVFGPTSAMFFVAADVGGGNELRVHTLTDVLNLPSRSVTSVSVSNYFTPPDVPQPGATSPPLDSVDARIMSGVVRDGSLWTAHAIEDPAVDSETVVRWYELDVSSSPGSSPTVFQSGNVDPGPGLHSWMSHVNVDALGNMAIGFSVAGPSQFASIGYAFRLASDAPGTTRPVQIVRSGEGIYSLLDGGGRNRWGDYTGLAIDPDGSTFWLFNEYPTAVNTWNTFVAGFTVDPDATVQDLVDQVDALATGGALNAGQANALNSKLSQIANKMAEGKLNTACGQLGAFLNQVQDFVASGILTPAEGQDLIDTATNLEALLGC
jgi:hypothetical protein